MFRARILQTIARIMHETAPNARARGWNTMATRGLRSLSSANQVRPALEQPSRHVHARTKQEEDAMFCYQCEQTKQRKGCTVVGVCGKTPEVAALQDLLVHGIKGLAVYGHAFSQAGGRVPDEIHDFVFSALFSTLTNVNFDADRFPDYISRTLEFRDQLKAEYEVTCLDAETEAKQFGDLDEITWSPKQGEIDNLDALHAKGHAVGILQEKAIYGDDITGVRQMVIYGIKGMATYARHGQALGHWDENIGNFTLEALSWLVAGPEHERRDLEANLTMALRVGEWNLRGLELLDQGHKAHFGTPSPAAVNTNPVPGKCILVSGHDMHDLEMILKATEGTGINVYTHGEMLPAHGYPELRKHKHFVGQYGSAWQLQKFEFPTFPGPIAITTNCLVEPLKSYKDRLYTLNDCGWPGAKHLELPRDVDVIIESANQCAGFTEEDCKGKLQKKELTTGYGHDVILSQADKIIGSINSGDLKRVFVIGGCDGAEHKRNYFSTLADSLPKDTLILTMGCAKYRFNNHEFGTLAQTGIPRLLDMGQCNDAYGAVVIAKALANALSTDINSLPLSINLSWFEQKAVAVLLSLLHLGVRDIRVGPVLPAFLTQNVMDILVEKYNLQPVDIRHPLEDLHDMMDE